MKIDINNVNVLNSLMNWTKNIWIDPNDSSSFLDDDEVVEAIKPFIIEWFGENFGLGFDLQADNIKYWYVSKMKVDNSEIAKKVGKLFELLEDM